MRIKLGKMNAVRRSLKHSFHLKVTFWHLKTFVFGMEEKINAPLFLKQFCQVDNAVKIKA